MKLENAKEIVEALNSEGIDATVRKEYSGRSMYGKTTAAVSTRYQEDVFQAASDLGMKLGRRSLRIDSMGLGYVVY